MKVTVSIKLEGKAPWISELEANEPDAAEIFNSLVDLVMMRAYAQIGGYSRVSIKPEDQSLGQDATPCPLCLESDGEPSEWFETMWQEMECDATTLVRVHKFCTWQIVREFLYEREGALLEQEETGAGRGPTEAEHWIGWEPRTPWRIAQ